MATCWWPTQLAFPARTRRRAGAGSQNARIADFRGQRNLLTVSADGARVGFGYEPFGASPARFDMATRTLVLGPAQSRDGRPETDGLTVKDWEDEFHPDARRQGVALGAYESSRSLAIHPSGNSFVLGTEWSLRAFDAQGAPLWSRPAPGCLGRQHHRRRQAGRGGLWRRDDPLASDDRRRGAARLHAVGRPDQLGRLDAGRLLRRHGGRARRAALACQPGLGAGRQRACRGHPRLLPAGLLPLVCRRWRRRARSGSRSGRAQPGSDASHP